MDNFVFPRILERIDHDGTVLPDLNGEGRMAYFMSASQWQRDNSETYCPLHSASQWTLVDSFGRPLFSPCLCLFNPVFDDDEFYLAEKSDTGWHDIVLVRRKSPVLTCFRLLRYDPDLDCYFALRMEVHYHDLKRGFLVGSSYARGDWDDWEAECAKYGVPFGFPED